MTPTCLKNEFQFQDKCAKHILFIYKTEWLYTDYYIMGMWKSYTVLSTQNWIKDIRLLNVHYNWWNSEKNQANDVAHMMQVCDNEHYGLVDKVKEEKNHMQTVLKVFLSSIYWDTNKKKGKCRWTFKKCIRVHNTEKHLKRLESHTTLKCDYTLPIRSLRARFKRLLSNPLDKISKLMILSPENWTSSLQK